MSVASLTLLLRTRRKTAFASRCLLAGLLLCCAAIPHARAEDQGLNDLLQLLRLTAAATTTLQSSFTQTTTIPLFATPVESKGRFAFKAPAQLRWEYLEPAQEGFILNNGGIIRWEGEKAEHTVLPVSANPLSAILGKQLLGWISFDLDWIRKDYTLSLDKNTPRTLILEPKTVPLKEIIASLRISFSDKGTASSVLVKEQSGSATLLQFTATEVNSPLTEKEFQ